MKIFSRISGAIVVALFVVMTVSPQDLHAQEGPGVLEIPTPDIINHESGIGSIRGLYCNLPPEKKIQWSFDGGALRDMPYGFDREDSRSSCGSAKNGFLEIINWNLLGSGLHLIEVFVDGILLDSAKVSVSTFGTEFLTGIGDIFYTLCTFENEDGHLPKHMFISWREGKQNWGIDLTADCDEARQGCPNADTSNEQLCPLIIIRCC